MTAQLCFICILKPILFYLLIILFDGSGDINFSYSRYPIISTYLILVSAQVLNFDPSV